MYKKELIKYLISERESILASFDGSLSDEQLNKVLLYTQIIVALAQEEQLGISTEVFGTLMDKLGEMDMSKFNFKDLFKSMG